MSVAHSVARMAERLLDEGAADPGAGACWDGAARAASAGDPSVASAIHDNADQRERVERQRKLGPPVPFAWSGEATSFMVVLQPCGTSTPASVACARRLSPVPARFAASMPRERSPRARERLP